MLHYLGFLCGQESVQFYCRLTNSYLMVGNTDDETNQSVEQSVKFELTNNKNEVSVCVKYSQLCLIGPILQERWSY